MNKYTSIFMVLFVFMINMLFAEGGLNSTSGAMSEINNSDIDNTRIVFIIIFVALIIISIFFILRKVIKKLELSGYSVFIIIVSVICFLVYMAMPNFKMDSNRYGYRRYKACYSNIRVVQGAVEMYNMDSKIMMKNMNMQNLVKGGYLKQGIKCPEFGEDMYTNVGNLDGDGEVSCGKEGGTGVNLSNPKLKYHGTLSGR